MRARIGILLLVMVLGFSGSACLNRNMERETEKLSWWTLLYERPNPDRLPVKVSFWFAKNT